MPERFRSTGSTAGGPTGGGSSKTKKLVVTLIIVLVVAGLGVVGLYVFNKVVKSNTNAGNTNSTLNTNALNSNTTNTPVNTSSNLNTSSNTNLNNNLNTNSTNTNGTNTNVSSNTNSTSNVNAATNTSTNTNTSTAVTPLPSNTDTDNDGLTDTEELVYGTDAAKPDTDGDGFLDGRQVRADGTVIGELVNLYNPKGPDKLETSSLVKRIENASKTYGLLVPFGWTINESSGLLVVTPTTSTGEFFQVRSYDNATRQTPQQWYQANNPQAQMSLTKSVAFNGLEGIRSEDGTSVYFFKDAQVFGLTYTTGSLSKVNFWTTFEMMMKSFKLVAAS